MTAEDPGRIDADDEPSLDTELKREFLVQVAILNLGILALALGAFLLYFRGDLVVGSGLLAGGLTLVILTYRRYRSIPEAA